jgi:hypothetical protein
VLVIIYCDLFVIICEQKGSNDSEASVKKSKFVFNDDDHDDEGEESVGEPLTTQESILGRYYQLKSPFII